MNAPERHGATGGWIVEQMLGPLAEWMAHVQGMLYRIVRNQEGEMAAIDDINAAISNLKDAINTALTDLQNKAAAGVVTAADVQNVIDQLNSEHDSVLAAVAAVDNPPAPAPAPSPAPTTGP